MAHHSGREGNKAIHMAYIALRAGRDVCRWLAQCIHAHVGSAMASRALAGQPRMIHPCRFESSVIRMTRIALGAGGNMRCHLAERGHSIMAGRTVTSCRRVMRISCASPGCHRLVTGIALRRGRNVGRRFGQRIGSHEGTVMATRTIAGRHRAGSPAMAHRRRGKQGGIAMTGVTLSRGRNMIGRLTHGRRAVVTSRATPGNRR